MGTTLIGMLHQGQVSIYKMDQSAEAIWWHRMHREIREKKTKIVRAAQVRI